MAVQSSHLGAAHITGSDAQFFTRKVQNSRASARAQESAQRGSKLTKQLAKKGYVVLKARKVA